jgi:hypothetical protein
VELVVDQLKMIVIVTDMVMTTMELAVTMEQ